MKLIETIGYKRAAGVSPHGDDNTRPNLFPAQPGNSDQLFPSPGESEDDIIKLWQKPRRKKKRRSGELTTPLML